MKTTIQWKFLGLVDGNIQSVHGDCTWNIGKWQKPILGIEMYTRGYHSSPGIVEAYRWVNGTILAQVECKGKHIDGATKSVWESMRITKAWMWTNEAHVALVRRCIEIHLKRYPDDNWGKKALIDLNDGYPVLFSYWDSDSDAGMLDVYLYHHRTNSDYYVSFRACDVNKWLAEDILPTLEEVKG